MATIKSSVAIGAYRNDGEKVVRGHNGVRV
jgi:hypothetical protein